MKILGLVPGGQTKGNSPSELLMKEVSEISGWDISIINLTFDALPKKEDISEHDLIWADMDGKFVPHIGAKLKQTFGTPLYIHGEWVPPYRVQEGWESKYDTPTSLKYKDYYIQMMKAMTYANLVSLGFTNDMVGSFNWIKENFGYEYENTFSRLQYVKRFEYFPRNPEYKVATIARASDRKKLVDHTVSAISYIKPQLRFDIIGATSKKITEKYNWINCMGNFNDDSKVQIFANSLLAVQHWSGIPPAEAIQQMCPVVAYECPEMKELYRGALIWVKDKDVKALTETIVKVINNSNFANKQAEKALNMLNENKLGVSYIDIRAKEIISKIEEIL